MGPCRTRQGAFATTAIAIGLAAFAAAQTFTSPPVAQTFRSAHESAPEEVRALWVLRTALGSPQAIRAMVKTARDSGFNTLLVQVRGRGDSYFTDGIEPRSSTLALQPATFDPLSETLAAARDAGLQVHAWINLNLVASAVELPAARSHIVYRRPDWLMVPRAIAEDVAALDPRSPAFVGTLARWTRTQADVEGLYLSPIPPASAAYTESVVTDLVSRYAVDGVHLDYVRYPTDEFDYSVAAIGEFRAEVSDALPAAERARLDDGMKVDLFAYPDALPDRWRDFRRSRLSALVARLRAAVKHVRPSTLLSAAVTADSHDAFERRLQDWRGWLEHAVLDVACPMAYTTDPRIFEAQVADARHMAGSRAAVWAGIGAYRLAPRQTIDHVQAARRLGVSGIALFSYDSLTDPAQSVPDYLAQIQSTVGSRQSTGKQSTVK